MRIVLGVIWFSLALRLTAAADKCPVLQDSGISNVKQFLDNKEVQVQQIAQYALENYQLLENASALAACNSDTVCSRATCKPLLRDLAEKELTCEAIPNNPNCVGRDNSSCTTALVSRKRSYVWLSAIAYATNGALDCDMSTTICAQQKLDEQVFIPQTNNTFINIEAFVRFGSNNGILRNYPGQEASDKTCSTYDLRKRPWYVGATSVQKQIVVLLDKGDTLSNILNPLSAPGTTAFTYSRTITEEFLDTLSPGDQISVYTCGSSSSEATSFVGKVTVNRSNYSVDDPEVQHGLRKNVSDISDPASGPSTANISASLLKALDQFHNSPKILKVIILLTAGELSGEDLEPSLIQRVTDLNVTVFIYRYLGSAVGSSNDTVTEMLQNISCKLGGWYEEAIYSDQNPLGFLQSFNSYVARLRSKLKGQNRPFWVPTHSGPADIGPLISVSYPVFNNDFFLGVASIDIIADRFRDQADNGSVDTLLQTYYNILNSLPLEESTRLPEIQCGKKLAQSLPLALQNSDSCMASGATGLCKDLDMNNKNVTLRKRSCCDNCCSQHKNDALSGGQLAGVIIGSSAGIISALLFCCVVWKLCLPTNHEQGPHPFPGESSPRALTREQLPAYKWDEQL